MKMPCRVRRPRSRRRASERLSSSWARIRRHHSGRRGSPSTTAGAPNASSPCFNDDAAGVGPGEYEGAVGPRRNAGLM